MIETLHPMGPIFLMIGIGAAFVRSGVFPASGLPALNAFAINVCVPVVLFAAIERSGGLDELDFDKSAVYAAASLTAILFTGLVLRTLFGQDGPTAAILGMSAGTSNSVFLGYPIASVIAPDRAADVFAWVVLAEIMIIIPATTSLALVLDRGTHGGSIGTILAALLKSPVTLGLAAGLSFLATGLSLPASVAAVRDSIVAAAPAIALFLIGGMLVNTRVSRTGPRVAAMSLGKLILHPLAVGMAFAVTYGVSAEATKYAVLFASIPIFATHAVFAERHGVGDVSASAIVITTIIAAFTVPACLTLLGPF